MRCEGCQKEDATHRVNFPGSPVLQHTFNVGSDCRERLFGLEDSVLVFELPECGVGPGSGHDGP